MKTALIGYTGFVGSTLMKQFEFDDIYRSTSISNIRGMHYDLVVCAGAPAQKWIANKDPEGDLRNIDHLIECLSSVTAGKFVLISTVDVFPVPVGVDETSPVTVEGHHAYGRNRFHLEEAVRHLFERHLVVRLPGLLGPGLRKNALYDLLNNNQIQMIDSRAVYQFYPMVRLWDDIQVSLRLGVSLVHLTAVPLSVKECAREGFGIEFSNVLGSNPQVYDFRTCYAEKFGATGSYQYSRRECLLALKYYAQSEPRAQAER